MTGLGVQSLWTANLGNVAHSFRAQGIILLEAWHPHWHDNSCERPPLTSSGHASSWIFETTSMSYNIIDTINENHLQSIVGWIHSILATPCLSREVCHTWMQGLVYKSAFSIPWSLCFKTLQNKATPKLHRPQTWANHPGAGPGLLKRRQLVGLRCPGLNTRSKRSRLVALRLVKQTRSKSKSLTVKKAEEVLVYAIITSRKYPKSS